VEAIVIVFVLIALGVLSMRFGHDSRDGLRGREEELASLGMTWGKVAQQPTARESRRPRTSRPRALMAVRRLVAQRLEPEPEDVVWPVLQNYPYGTTGR
jgi:hypothetical protein